MADLLNDLNRSERSSAVSRQSNVTPINQAIGATTDATKAPKGTIRGDFGTEMMKNVVHASDSVENGKAELARFFKPEELFG